jgi:transcriptional regulator with XRE-family HTH domain
MTSQEANPHVGLRIRVLREESRMSLRALAERCGLSVNAISRIERGENSPTVASLHLLAKALGVPITEFFRTAEDRSIVHVKHGQRTRMERSGLALESLGIGLRDQKLEPFIVRMQPSEQSHSEAITHAGQEFVYCLEGAISYQINDTVYILEQGDSLLFEASQPHRFWNGVESCALLLLVFETGDGHPAARQRHMEA